MIFSKIYYRISNVLKRPLAVRTFVLVMAGMSTLFVTYHAVIWFGFTKILFYPPATYGVGDLARIGYIPSNIYLRKNEVTLPRQHIHRGQWDGAPVDVLTIGDSFANGGGQGPNPYFQDYLASSTSLRIMNLQPFREAKDNYIESIMLLLNSGMIERLKPKTIIIESVERFATRRFSTAQRWDINASLDEVDERIRTSTRKARLHAKPRPGLINTANYKFLYYALLYGFSSNAFGNSLVYRAKLREPLFSTADGRELLFVKPDVTNIPEATPKHLDSLNANLNRLQASLASFGIRLYVLIAVDKYDLYRDYILDNPFPKNPFFNLLRKVPKTYTLIDTKAILSPMLWYGEKDVYYADDTHWSTKGKEAVVTQIVADLEHTGEESKSAGHLER